MIIRVRFNYSHVLLGENGVILANEKSVIGSSLCVLMSDQSTKRFPFAGFKERDLTDLQFVKVVEISAYSPSNEQFGGNMIDVSMNQYCVGSFLNGRVYLLKENEHLIIRDIEAVRAREKGEVIDISAYRLK